MPRSYSRHLQLNIYSRNKKEKVTLPNAMTSRNIFLKKAAVTCSIKNIYIPLLIAWWDFIVSQVEFLEVLVLKCPYVELLKIITILLLQTG